MGLTIDKILVILVIAMFILGPERLPYYAKKLGELVRSVKRMADGAKDRLRDEMGPEFDDVDWKQLDPRQYDPRRIIRDALVEDEKEAQLEARRARAAQASQNRRIGGGPVSSAAAPAERLAAVPDGAAGVPAAGVVAVGAVAAASGSPEAALNGDAHVAVNFDEEAT